MALQALLENRQPFPPSMKENSRDMGARVNIIKYLKSRELGVPSNPGTFCTNCHFLFSDSCFDSHLCSFDYDPPDFSSDSGNSVILSDSYNDSFSHLQEFYEPFGTDSFSSLERETMEYLDSLVDPFKIVGYDFPFDLFEDDYSLFDFFHRFECDHAYLNAIRWIPQSKTGSDYSPDRNRLNSLGISLSTHEKLIRQERALRVKGKKFHRKLKHHKDLDLTLMQVEDNVRLLRFKKTICICELNKAFSRLEFKPFSSLSPNDTIIESIARSCDLDRKIKLGLYVLCDRITLERVLNHCEMLYLESLLRSDTPHVVFFFQSIVSEMQFLVGMAVPSLAHECICKKPSNLRCRIEFTPQSLIPDLEMGESTLQSLEDLVSTFSNAILESSRNVSRSKFDFNISDSSKLYMSGLTDHVIKSIGSIAKKGVKANVSHDVGPNVSSGISTFLDSLKPVLPVLAIALIGTLYVIKKVSLAQALGLLSILGLIYFDSVKEKVISLFSMFFDYFKPQAVLDKVESLFTIFTCHNFGSTLCSDGLFQAFKKHSRYSQMKTSSVSLISDVLTILQNITSFFCDFFEKERYVFFSGKNPELCLFLEDVSNFIKDREKNPTIDNESGIALGILEKRANDLSSIVVESSDRQKLNFCVQNLKPWIDKKRSGFWYGAGPRIEPLSICIEGESQIGKSHMMQALIVSVSAMLFEGKKLDRFKQNRNSEIYGYNWNRKHQDGYVGQTHVVLDDFGELRDVVGSEKNPYAEMVHMINTVAYHMEMAELQNKADSFFKSEFVWMTTNNTKWDIQSMNHPEAFINRIHYAFHCGVKEEYRNQNVKEDAQIYERWEHTEVWLIKYLPHKKYEYVRRIGGFYDLRDFIIEAYKRHYAKGEKMMDIHDDLVEEAMKIRFSPQIFMGTTCAPIFTTKLVIGGLLQFAIPFGMWVALQTRWGQEKLMDYTVKAMNFVEENWFPTCTYLHYQGNLYEYFSWAQICANKVRCHGCTMCDPYSTYTFNVSDELRKYPLFSDFTALKGKTAHCAIMVATCFRNGISIESIHEDFFSDSTPIDQCLSDVEDLVEILDGFDKILENYVSEDDLPYPCFNNISFFEWCSERTDNWYCFAIYLATLRVKTTIVPDYEPGFNARFKRKFNENVPFFMEVGETLKKIIPMLAVIVAVYGCSYLSMKVIRSFTSTTKEKLNEELIENCHMNRAYNSKVKIEGQKIIATVKLDDNYFFEIHYLFDVPIDLNTNKYLTVTPLGDLDLEIPENDDSFIVLKSSNGAPDVVINELSAINVHYDLKKNWLCVDDIFVRNHAKFLKYNKLPDDHPFFIYFDLMREYYPQSKIVNETPLPEVKRSVFKPQFGSPSKIVPVTQFVYDQTEEEIARKVNLRNEILFYLPRQGIVVDPLVYKKTKQNFSAIMIGGLVGIMNGHSQAAIYDLLDSGSLTLQNPIVIIRANDPHRVPIFWTPSKDDFCAYAGFGSGDAVAFKLPSDLFENFPNITKYFVERKKLKATKQFPGTLWTISHGPVIRSVGVSISTTTYGTTDYCGYENGNCWMYSHPTVDGDCGSMLTITDVKSGSSKIIGMHCAGANSTHGLAFPVFREDVHTIREYFNDISDDDIIGEMELVPQGSSVFHATHGKVDFKMPPYKTKIVKAPLYDICKPYHVIANPRKRVINGEDFNPVTFALSKMVPAHVPLNTEIISVIADFMLSFMVSKDKLPNYTRSVQSFETCVVGKDCDPYWKGINKASSLGYPKNKEVPPGFKGKQHIFGIYEYELDSVEAKAVKNEFDQAIVELRNCYRRLYFFVDTPKDECLPEEKVKEGKIRLFAVGALLILLLSRSYFGDFRAWYLHNRIYNESAIGINVYSMDWHEKVRYLSFGKPEERNFIFIDIKKYDGSMARVWMYYWFLLMCRWYNDELNKQIRMNLAEHIMNSYHIINGTIYAFRGGQSSGGPNTADLNTGVLGMLIYYACLIIVFDFKTAAFSLDPILALDTLKSIAEDLRMQRFGDDLESCVKVGSRYYGIITESSIIKALSYMGIEATSDTKDGAVHDYRYLSEGTFLKRTSRYITRHQRFVGMLDVRSILKSVQWFRNTDPSLEDYRQTLQKSLEELSLHPKETFDKYAPYIITEGRNRVNFLPITSDYNLLQKLCFRRDDYGLTPQLGVLPQLSITSTSDAGPEMRLGLVGEEKQENDSNFVLHSQPACSLHSRIGVEIPNHSGDNEWRPQSYFSLTATNNDNNNGDTVSTTEAMQFNVTDEVEISFSAADHIPHPITGNSDDVKNWLRRPFRVFTGTWSTSANLGDNIFSYNLHAYFLSNTMASAKLLGYKYIKCTHVLRVELNPTPFHAGAFMLQWHPFPAAEKAISMHRTPICSSQLPGVMVLCADNSAQIKIPWVYPSHGYNLYDVVNTFDWGAVIAKVYSPLATGTGAVSISMNLFQWLEDVELFGIWPQAKGFTATKSRPSKVIPSDDEKNNGEGPITRAFGIGEKVADSLSTIPMFAPICKPASWVFNTAARVSSLFGWSKPSLGEGGKLIAVHQMSDAYSPNSNGTDNTFVLTPSVNYSLTPSKMLTIRDEDEMSLEFLSTRWSYLTHFGFTTSNNMNDILYTQTLRLDYFGNYQSVLIAVGQYYHVHSLTPLAYLNKVFGMWRGDLEFKFVLVKTGYHTGQLRFAYSNTSIALNANTEQYASREIIDLQSGDEFFVTCPYISERPYLRPDESLGMLEVTCVTTLTAPSTVANNIDILMFVRGAPGFDFQAPTNKVPFPVFAPQGLKTEEEGNVGNSNIGGLATKARAMDIMSQWTVGENVESILSLIKRFSYMSFYFSTVSTTVPAGSAYTFRPHFVGFGFVDTNVALTAPISAFDQLGRFAWLYLFRRGGVKIKVKTIFGAPESVVYKVEYSESEPGSSVFVSALADVTRFDSNVDLVPDPMLVSSGVSLPQWDRNFGAMQTSITWPSRQASKMYLDIIYPQGATATDLYVDGTSRIYRAASDDFHFSFFVGIPTCMFDDTLYAS